MSKPPPHLGTVGLAPDRYTIGLLHFTCAELVDFQDRFDMAADSDLTSTEPRNAFAYARPMKNRPLVLLDTPDPFRKARPCALQPVSSWSLVIVKVLVEPREAVVDLHSAGDGECRRIVGALTGSDVQLAKPMVVGPNGQLTADIFLPLGVRGSLILGGLLVREMKLA